MRGPSLLAIVPHPDDETYSFGGTLALAAAAGWPVTVVAATAGEHGERHDGTPAEPTTLAADRIAELGSSSAALGAGAPHCWRLPDGGLRRHDPEAIARLVALANELSPTAILALGKDGGYGHPDHLAVHAWVEAARPHLPGTVRVLYAAFPPGLFSEQHGRCAAAGVLGDPPEVAADALGDILADYEVGVAGARDQKLAAIASHRTQLPGGDPLRLFPGDTVERLLNVERFRDASGAPNAAFARLLASLTD